MRLAVLSNINVNGIVRILDRKHEVYQVEGYGNEIEILMNPNSTLYSFEPQVVFLIEDIAELIKHSFDFKYVKNQITEWFELFSKECIENVIYYVSDAFLYAKEYEVDSNLKLKREIEYTWDCALHELTLKHKNVRVFSFRRLVEACGTKETFSTKMWYMGKIKYTTFFQNSLAEEIDKAVTVENRICKKVLLLDLDNTLWGGLAGEHNITPVKLGDDGVGMVYKDLQRVIRQIKKQGVLLGIVSKNNEEDALEIINNHPHMILREDDFAIKKINWQLKPQNISDIAKELNLGLDSFVYLDDSPQECALVREMLPEVTVVDFPNNVEELPGLMYEIWQQFFEKAIVTEEDIVKTEQYRANALRENYRKIVGSFNDYLMGLQICLFKENPNKNLERLLQLLNKTNQFNLTTKRYTQDEFMALANDEHKKIFCYRVTDKFGDYGIVAVVIVDLDESKITDFTMSCRVMGKNIENAIIEDVENYLWQLGTNVIRAEYRFTEKSKPVSKLYENLGYCVVETTSEGKLYELKNSLPTQRDYCLKKE